jgi:hypothetical protein
VTRDGPGVSLSQETGAGAQATRGGPGAALSREAGTTPPPLLPRLSWAVRAWRRPDQAVVASTRPPPYSGCHPPPSTTSTTTTTSTLTTSVLKGYHLHVVLVGFYSSHSIRAIMTLQLRGMSIRRILPSTYSPVSPSVVLPL